MTTAEEDAREAPSRAQAQLAELAETYRSVGELVSRAAWVDSTLTNVIAMTTSKKDWERVRLMVVDRFASVKVQMLQDVMPSEWIGGKQLIAALKRANTYRNAMAHSMIEVNLASLDREVTEGFWAHSREKKPTPVPIDFDEIAAERQHLLALGLVLHSLLEAILLGQVVVGEEADLRDACGAVGGDLLDLIFPAEG